MIEMHRLIVTRVLFGHLSPEPLGLIFRVVQLAKAVCQFAPPDKELESVSDIGVVVVSTRKGPNIPKYAGIGTVIQQTCNSSDS